jgi:hypothetical protein
VKLCVKLGLYGKELVDIDGGKFKAVNSKDRNYTEGKLKEQIRWLEGKGTVEGEFALLVLIYNLKRVITILGVGKLLKAFAR